MTVIENNKRDNNLERLSTRNCREFKFFWLIMIPFIFALVATFSSIHSKESGIKSADSSETMPIGSEQSEAIFGNVEQSGTVSTILEQAGIMPTYVSLARIRHDSISEDGVADVADLDKTSPAALSLALDAAKTSSNFKIGLENSIITNLEQMSDASGLEQTSVTTGLEQMSVTTGLEQMSVATGLEQTSITTGLEQMSVRTGLEQMSVTTGLEQMSATTSLKQTLVTMGLEQISVMTSLEQMSVTTGLEQMSVMTGLEPMSVTTGLEQMSATTSLEQTVVTTDLTKSDSDTMTPGTKISQVTTITPITTIASVTTIRPVTMTITPYYDLVTSDDNISASGNTITYSASIDEIALASYIITPTVTRNTDAVTRCSETITSSSPSISRTSAENTTLYATKLLTVDTGKVKIDPFSELNAIKDIKVQESAKAAKQPVHVTREPVYVTKRPINVTVSRPVEVTVPQPFKVTVLRPVKVTVPRSVKVTVPQTVKVTVPRLVKVTVPRPVKVTVPRPVKVTVPRPVKITVRQPIKERRLQPIRNQPNIILILVDDVGWNDVGWHNPSIVTPNLDKLRREGLELTQSYVSPVCSPSRGALLTGYYPFRLGLQQSKPHGLPLNITLLPQYLQKLGYSTHMIGKWHLGFCNWNYTPTYRGFDSFFGFYTGQQDYYKHKTSRDRGYDFRYNTEVYRPRTLRYSTTTFGSHASDVISSHNQSAPLFLYIAFQAAHTPLQVPAKYEVKNAGILNPIRRTFAGMMTAVDDAVGDVITALKRRHMLNKSLIVFLSDNGATPHGGGNNWPLRGGKSTLWEGGTRVPTFVWGKMINVQSHSNNGMIHAVDWTPTLVSAAGGSAHDMAVEMDGVSQWKMLLRGGSSARTEFVYDINQLSGQAAIREGRYKLIEGSPGHYSDWFLPNDVTADDLKELKRRNQQNTRHVNQTLLFDVEVDPIESNDISSSHKSLVDKMKQMLHRYRLQEVQPLNPPRLASSLPKFWNGVWSPGWC